MNYKDPGAEINSFEFVEPKETETGNQEEIGQGANLLRNFRSVEVKRKESGTLGISNLFLH